MDGWNAVVVWAPVGKALLKEGKNRATITAPSACLESWGPSLFMGFKCGWAEGEGGIEERRGAVTDVTA